MVGELVAAEWAHEPRPAQVTRAAILADLVGRDLPRKDVAVVATTMRQTKIVPDPTDSRAVMVAIPKEAPVRPKSLLWSAWKKVQTLWGGTIPPVEKPKPVEPAKPISVGIPGLDTVLQRFAQQLGFQRKRQAEDDQAQIEAARILPQPQSRPTQPVPWPEKLRPRISRKDIRAILEDCLKVKPQQKPPVELPKPKAPKAPTIKRKLP